MRHLGCLLGHQTGLGGVVRSEQMLAALGGLKFVPDSLDDVGAFLIEGQFQSCYLSLDLFHRRVGRGQGRRNLGKLAAKVGELDLVILEGCVIEHFGEGLGRRCGRQLVFRLAGDAIRLSLGEFLLKLAELLLGDVVFLRGKQQAGSVGIAL